MRFSSNRSPAIPISYLLVCSIRMCRQNAAHGNTHTQTDYNVYTIKAELKQRTHRYDTEISSMKMEWQLSGKRSE